MWFVVLNAIFFHFYLFHPYPSPRPGKCCHLKKRLQIALCGRIALFYRYLIPYEIIYYIIEQKIENSRSKSTAKNWILLRVLPDACFLVNHIHPTSKHNLLPLSKSHLLPFTISLQLSQPLYHIQYYYIDIQILLPLCKYL